MNPIIPDEVVALAVRGGWFKNYLDPEKLLPCTYTFDGEYFVITGENSILIRKCLAEIACDGTFFQALGRELGWGEERPTDTLIHEDRFLSEAEYHAHRLYDLLLSGQDTTEYWNNLLKV